MTNDGVEGRKPLMKETTKRDTLRAIEMDIQRRWAMSRPYEADAPPLDACVGQDRAKVVQDHPKFFACMAYPYMNGSLHLGHAFSLSKVEFMVRYEKMTGKNVLFPLGFHCTGMPIKACADKLQREMELFGADFDDSGPSDDLQACTLSDDDQSLTPDTLDGNGRHGNPSCPVDSTKIVAKKGKVASKDTGLSYQYRIMESIGVPRKEIKNFADATHWLRYFPPIAIRDCNGLGLAIDWRRSFLTTDHNPYYDSFVRWQMNKLHQLQKIKFGERYTVYSPKDDQPCMDHDRQSGEGLGPQEYTAIKLLVLDFANAAKIVMKRFESKLNGRHVYLIAATLRPETMYGQTAVFVSPNIEYGVFDIDEKTAYICTFRAARNMAYQGILRERGVVPSLFTIFGRDLVGTQVEAPLSMHHRVWVLPMETISPDKGSAIVCCVPSDSPDDWITQKELQNKAEYYQIEKNWASLAPISIINTPTCGTLAAEYMVNKLKIQSPKDSKSLSEAKEIVYKEGYYQGTMLVGKYAGLKVEQAKLHIRKELVDAGNAFAYYEPEALVMSRSGDECVVALCDQWYIDYGEPSWREIAHNCLSQLNAFHQETRNQFKATLQWLNQWACARSYGLGSKLPWDTQYLVESLSDSTIYTAYYTVAHYLQGNLDGSIRGSLDIDAQDMTDEVWDFVLLGRIYSEDCRIPESKLKVMRWEFCYWYPLDVRVSGKDLIQNHLTMFIYIHCALFPEKHWPKGIRANGHLMLNKEKMSKSTGNFLTMAQAVERFGADVMRITLADAGDDMNDANFDEEMSNSVILRLYTLKTWCTEQIEYLDKLRNTEYTFYDLAFENEMNELIEEARQNYEKAYYKGALKYGFYEFTNSMAWFREALASIGGLHRNLVLQYIENQCLVLLPIAPHITEHIWTDILKKKSPIATQLFPKPTKTIDISIHHALEYIKALKDNIRTAESNQLRKQRRGREQSFDPKKPKRLTIYVASCFPAWQEQYISMIKDSFDMNNNTIDEAGLQAKCIALSGKDMKKAMPFVQSFKQRLLRRPAHIAAEFVLNRKLLFDEESTLTNAIPFLKSICKIEKIVAVRIDPNQENAVSGPLITGGKGQVEIRMNIELAKPGEPVLLLENL